MTAERLAALCLIGSFVASAASVVTGAPGLYATQDIAQRLQVIATYRARWLITQGLVGVYGLLTIPGFALLAYAMRSTRRLWIPVLGAGAMILGTLAGMYFVYLQTVDPRGGYSGAYPTPEALAYWFWLAGLVLFGVAYLQAGWPSWLGYVSAGGAIVYAAVYLLTGAGFLTPFVEAIVALVTAVVILRLYGI
jgi:hypothetical protein